MKMMTKVIENTKSRVNQIITSMIAKITSVSQNGKTLNGLPLSGTELRDMRIALPYGISSSGLDGMKIFILYGDDNVVIGADDNDRPDVLPGEVIFYSKFGQQIKFDENGDITFTDNIGNSVTLDQIVSQLHSH